MKALLLFLGILAGNAVGVLFLIALAYGILHMFPDAGLEVSLPSLVFVPISMGLAAAWVWKPLNLRIYEVILQSLACTLVGLGLAAIVFHEGIICLIILSPVFYGSLLAGALAGRYWFRRDRNRLNLCLAPVIALLVALEPATRTTQTSVVVDEIHIAASPARVWPHVLAFAPIPDPPNYWLFHLGLPYPTETVNGGDFVGASRACKFSGGAVFKETVAELEPGKLLTFDIIEMPADPELLGHLDARRGQFELRDNGDGTTTLIGRTWYTLHVRPGWYFDWWTHDIFRAVHLRVMGNIQRLAETPP